MDLTENLPLWVLMAVLVIGFGLTAAVLATHLGVLWHFSGL